MIIRTILKIIKYIFILIFIFLVSSYLYFDAHRDYCFRKHKKFTDEEFTLIALDSIFKEGKIKVDETDNAPAKYLLKHPECCSFSKVPDRIDTYGFAEVTIKYELTAQAKIEYKKQWDERYIRLSVCGFPLSSRALAHIELKYLNFLFYLLGY